MGEAIEQLSVATSSLVSAVKQDKRKALAVASPYLTLVGTVVGGWLLAKSALAARQRRSDGVQHRNYLAKESVAQFYATNLLPEAGGLSAVVASGADSTLALAADQF